MTERSTDWQRLGRLLDAHEQSLVGADDPEIVGLGEAERLEAEVRSVMARATSALAVPALRRGRRPNLRMPPARAAVVREASKLRGASFSSNIDQDDEDDSE